MNTSNIPPALSSYLRLPPQYSLNLVTDVIGATSNWVLLRFILAALHPNGSQQSTFNTAGDAQPNDETAVVLVSWMRDWTFWRDTAKRAINIDLASLRQSGRFVFVDGLSTFFNPDEHSSASVTSASSNTQYTLTSPETSNIQAVVSSAISSLKNAHPQRKILLMLDYPSILLETTEPPLKSGDLTSLILHLRSQVYCTVVALPADLPFVQAAVADVPQACTPLEIENAAFLTGLVHESRLVLGTRRLDTGWANDVSGVVRCTRGGAASHGEEGAIEVKEGEWLFHVSGDLSVKVWIRGASG